MEELKIKKFDIDEVEEITLLTIEQAKNYQTIFWLAVKTGGYGLQATLSVMPPMSAMAATSTSTAAIF